jgi:hypothetical protein
MKNLLLVGFTVFSLVLFSIPAVPQQSVTPPPKPVNDAPANTEVLKLLRAGMPESVVLNKIRATADKFDTSVDALVTLKQVGVTEAELSAILEQNTVQAQPAQQPPSAVPVDNGPSLAETMQFIQDKLNDIGKIAFIAILQDTSNESNGSTWNQTIQNEISNVITDQNQCRISYHWKTTNQGSPYWEKRIRTSKDENDVFLMRDVHEIVLKPFEQDRNELYAKMGSSAIVLSTIPSITVLVVRRAHGEENTFYFNEVDLADRVAKAMLHAVELCGGGNKDKF